MARRRGLYPCPLCWFVRRAADELELADVSREREAYRNLWDRRGKGTVPVLGTTTERGETLLGRAARHRRPPSR